MRPLVRFQLAVLSVVAVVAVSIMTFSYIQVQSVVGVGKMTVTALLPNGGGLYERSNVTYRGVTIGLVKSIGLDGDRVSARMEIDDDVEIPRDGLKVNVHSMSAIGEQFLDLVPTRDSGPLVSDGTVLPESNATIPAQIGPVLDQANALLASIPQDRLRTALDGAFRAFVGTRDDLVKLVSSARRIVDAANQNSDETVDLVTRLGPFLRPQGQSREAIQQWTKGLSDFVVELEKSDGHVRSIIDRSPAALSKAQKLFDDLAPTMPILLRDLVSLGQVAVTYNAGIEQMLVLTPPLVAAVRTMVNRGLSDQAVTAQFHTMAVPLCTTGYLPADQRRDPGDTSYAPLPASMYCAVPQNSPVVVRGARNLPCMEVPGKRAPTPEACRDPRPYQPKGEMPSSIDGSGRPDRQGLAGAIPQPAYEPSSGNYVAPDANVYQYKTIKGGSGWQSLLNTPQG